MAGLVKLSQGGLDLKGKKVVCIITGTGLKDPDLAANLEPVAMQECPAEFAALEQALTQT